MSDKTPKERPLDWYGHEDDDGYTDPAEQIRDRKLMQEAWDKARRERPNLLRRLLGLFS